MATIISHSFNVSLATEIGVSEAIILQHFFFWHQLNKDKAEMMKDGRVWFYTSRKTICEVFPYFSEQHIRTSIGHLLDRGLLVKGEYNASSFYKASWYAVTDKAVALLIGENQPVHQLKSTSPLVEINQSKDNNNINNNKLDNNNPSLTLPFSSPEFLEKWDILRKEPKWRNKTTHALQTALDKIAKYDEQTAVLAIEDAILGNYQGIFPERVNRSRTTAKDESNIAKAERVMKEIFDNVDKGYYGK